MSHEAVIVEGVRTAIGKAKRGTTRNARPDANASRHRGRMPSGVAPSA